LSQRVVTKAFGGKPAGAKLKIVDENLNALDLPGFLFSKNIRPFVSEVLIEGLKHRLVYKTSEERGGATPGIEALWLPALCDTLLRVRDAHAIPASQAKNLARAERIMDRLSKVNIIELVDAATGYNEEKIRRINRHHFRDFIRKECPEWEKDFPDELLDGIYRLYILSNDQSESRLDFLEDFIRKNIYAPVATSALQTVGMEDEERPALTSNRKGRYHIHQFLTDIVGRPVIRAHLWQLVGIIKISKNKQTFARYVAKAFPSGTHRLVKEALSLPASPKPGR
jgi:hypothetical protein